MRGEHFFRYRLPMVIYVGDASDMVNRIKSNHCSGNIEASALRRCVARAKGFALASQKRSSGSTRVRIDSPDRRRAEKGVSEYIRAGLWRLVSCDNYQEAHDFQWFVIERLDPSCNVTHKTWDRGRATRYQELLRRLMTSAPMTYAGVCASPLKAPGVYVLEHENPPDA